MTDDYTINADRSAAVANDLFWNEDMSTCPRGVKVQLLGEGGCAGPSGNYDGNAFWIGWAPMLRRRKVPA